MSDPRITICNLTWRLLKHFMWHNSHGNHIPDGKSIHGAKFQLCSSSHSSPSRIGPAPGFMRKRGLVREFPDPLCLASVWPDRRKTLRDFQNKSDNTDQLKWSIHKQPWEKFKRWVAHYNSVHIRKVLKRSLLLDPESHAMGQAILFSVASCSRYTKRLFSTGNAWLSGTTGVCLRALLKRERILRHERARE